MKVQKTVAGRPEKIKQKVIAPLNTEGEIRAKTAVCQFDYYPQDARGKRQPRLYLCDHRTLADIFLESALFDPKRNVLCIPGAEWESVPEEAKKSLRRFEKIFREPYQASVSFLRGLFRAREAGKSILLPVTEDARGMDRGPCMDAKGIVKLLRQLELPVCTVTFRKEPEEQKLFLLDVRPLFTPEELKILPEREAEAAVSAPFSEEIHLLGEKNTGESISFSERKRLRMREFLKSELYVELAAEETAELSAGSEREKSRGLARMLRADMTDGSAMKDSRQGCGSACVLRADMTGITLETGGQSFHRCPGALKSVAVYPGKETETGERGTILIYPYFDRIFSLFTAQKEAALDLQAAVEQMYEIVSAQ